MTDQPEIKKESKPKTSEQLLDEIADYLDDQTQYLKTIKNCVVFFVIIAVIGLLVLFFSTIL